MTELCTRSDSVHRQHQVVELSAEGLSTREIADRLGVSERTVQRDKVAADISATRRGWTAQDHHRALELLAEGCSLHDVAETLERSYGSVCYRFRNMGWTDHQTGQYNAMRAWEKRVLG